MATATKALPGEGGLHVALVTPTGPIASERTDAVIAPGELGEFQILPGHIPFLTELHPGVLTIGENRDKKIYAVGVGFLEVSPKGEVRVFPRGSTPVERDSLARSERQRTRLCQRDAERARRQQDGHRKRPGRTE